MIRANCYLWNNKVFAKLNYFKTVFFTTEHGGEFPSYYPPSFGSRHKDVNPDTPLTCFSVIDFDETPMRCCESLMLKNCIASHIGYEDSKNREDLMSITSKTYEHKKQTLEPKKVLM